MQPLGFRLWRVPVSAAIVTLRRSGARRLGVVVRRGSRERTLGGAAVRLAGERGAVLVLAVGGARHAQDIRLTLTGVA